MDYFIVVTTRSGLGALPGWRAVGSGKANGEFHGGGNLTAPDQTRGQGNPEADRVVEAER